MRPEEIDWSCPADLEPYSLMYSERLKRLDEYVHTAVGTYFISALSTLLEHALTKHAKSEYIKTPVLSEMGMSAEDKRQSAIDEFTRKMEEMKRDWDSAHKQGK